jgi:hypothetical protein
MIGKVFAVVGVAVFAAAAFATVTERARTRRKHAAPSRGKCEPATGARPPAERSCTPPVSASAAPTVPPPDRRLGSEPPCRAGA